MNIPININKLIEDRVVESTRIDYKKGFEPNAVLHTICAFANDIDNTGGGYIVLGIEEENGMPKFPVSGLDKDKIDGILKDLVGYCNQIEPRYFPIVEPVVYNGKNLILIWAPAGHGRPYKVNENIFTKSIKKYYIRKLNSTIAAKSEEEKELFYVSSDIPFDDRPNLVATIDDLDISLMRKHLHDVNSSLYELSLKMNVLEIAQSMQVVSGPDESLHPRNVGLLLFNENPEKFFRGARIEVVDIPNPTGEGMIEKNFTGPIQRQLKDALQYIQNYILKEKVFKVDDKAESVRIFNYPYRAVEEILSNAVYHKAYTINEPITVRITPTEMEITSFPGLDRSITDENIKKFNLRARRYRNRRIGDFFKELNLTEGRNTGIPNALVSLKNNGSNPPIFEMDDERTFLSVIIPVHRLFIEEIKDTSNKKQTRLPKEMTRKMILELLQEKPLSLTELAKALGKGRSKTLKAIVLELEKQSLVEWPIKSGRNAKIFIKK